MLHSFFLSFLFSFCFSLLVYFLAGVSSSITSTLNGVELTSKLNVLEEKRRKEVRS